MTQTLFPPLPLEEWQDTRDTLQKYARVLGKIRQALMPRQRHWWHVSLHVTGTGVTTTPMPAGDMTVELSLDFTAHLASIRTSRGDQWDLVLEGQPVKVFKDDTMKALADLGIQPEIDHSLFDDESPRTYDDEKVEAFWQALSQIDVLLKTFKGTHREETSPVQIWPHHFDISLVWFSGRLVPNQDPDNEDYSDEQMGFGFSTGDGGILEAYFYVTAYPAPDGWAGCDLPAGARWQTEGWTGAVMPYSAVVANDEPQELLMSFWQSAHGAGKRLMR